MTPSISRPDTALVGTVEYRGADVDFEVFVAPAMLAASAFNGAIFDSTK